MSKTSPLILVVEDEEILLSAIKRKLEASNIRAIPCLSGKNAIEALMSATELPDAIWLDYYLKDMNGLEFMEEVKKDPRFGAIPVFVVSNSASSDKIHGMLTLGVKEYFLKAETRLDDIIQSVQQSITAKE